MHSSYTYMRCVRIQIVSRVYGTYSLTPIPNGVLLGREKCKAGISLAGLLRGESDINQVRFYIHQIYMSVVGFNRSGPTH